MPKQKRQETESGEMRRRVRGHMQAGIPGQLRSEGRLMAFYVFYFADFRTCRLKIGVRGAARTLGVRPTTVRRGIDQLVEAGFLAVAEVGSSLSRTLYEVHSPPRAGGHEPCTDCTPAVSPPNTSRVRSVHERCAPRTRAVSSAHTSGDPLQVIPIGKSNITNGGITHSPSPVRAGASPADRAKEAGA